MISVEYSLKCTLGMLVINVFNHLGGIIYDIYRIFIKIHFMNVFNHKECSMKCTFGMT